MFSKRFYVQSTQQVQSLNITELVSEKHEALFQMFFFAMAPFMGALNLCAIFALYERPANPS